MTLTTHSPEDFNRQLADLDKIQETCKKLLSTKHYQALGEAGIHAIMARAKALGIHPFEALNGGFHCINGKVGMSTEMMAALVRQRGHSITKDPKSTNESVILHGKRADNGDSWTCAFTRADAEAAGLWTSATWKKYPAVMLYNRAMSMLFRQLFPDLSLGAGYVEDELKEITKTGDYAKNLPMAESEVVQEVKLIEEQKTPFIKISADELVSFTDYFNQLAPAKKIKVTGWLAENGYQSPADMTTDFFPIVINRLRQTIEQAKNESVSPVEENG